MHVKFQVEDGSAVQVVSCQCQDRVLIPSVEIGIRLGSPFVVADYETLSIKPEALCYHDNKWPPLRMNRSGLGSPALIGKFGNPTTAR